MNYVLWYLYIGVVFSGSVALFNATLARLGNAKARAMMAEATYLLVCMHFVVAMIWPVSMCWLVVNVFRKAFGGGRR